MRSATVGTPNGRVPPFAFGMSTRRTGGGKELPDDSRLPGWWRLPERLASNSAIDCPSTPAAPWLAFTRLKASQTSHLGILNGFALSTGSSRFQLADGQG